MIKDFHTSPEYNEKINSTKEKINGELALNQNEYNNRINNIIENDNSPEKIKNDLVKIRDGIGIHLGSHKDLRNKNNYNYGLVNKMINNFVINYKNNNNFKIREIVTDLVKYQKFIENSEFKKPKFEFMEKYFPSNKLDNDIQEYHLLRKNILINIKQIIAQNGLK